MEYQIKTKEFILILPKCQLGTILPQDNWPNWYQVKAEVGCQLIT